MFKKKKKHVIPVYELPGFPKWFQELFVLIILM